MKTYIWANPATGIREQDPSRKNAKLRVWEELQGFNQPPNAVKVWEAEATGHGGSQGGDFTVPIPPECWILWASPADAMLWIRPANANCYSATLKQIQVEFQRCQGEPIDTVIIYRGKPAFTIRKDDPRPSGPWWKRLWVQLRDWHNAGEPGEFTADLDEIRDREAMRARIVKERNERPPQ